jgi:hypothetical protein
MYALHTEFEAVFHRSLGVVRCGGLEVQNVRTTSLEQSPVSWLNFKLETVKFLRHINPDVKVSSSLDASLRHAQREFVARSKPFNPQLNV